MMEFGVTPSVGQAPSREFAAGLAETSLKLLAALLLATALACSSGGKSNGNPVATAAASGGSGSSSSGSSGGSVPPPSGGSTAPTGGTSGTGSTGGTTPQASTPTRTYSMTFLPSPSGSVDGYELSLGDSSGSYDTFVDVPLNEITVTNGTMSHDLTLDADRDYFIVLRAYNAGGMSADSNEIRIAALVSNVIGGTSNGGSAAAQASYAAKAASSLAVAAGSPTADSQGESVAVAELADAGTDRAEVQTHEQIGDGIASLDFDGAGEHLANSVMAPLGTSYTFSMSIWARPLLDDAERRTMMDLRDQAGGDANRMTLAVVNSSDVELTLYGTTGSVLHRARFAEALLDGEWQHVAVVFDGSRDLEPGLYIDAQRQIAIDSSSADGTWEMADSARRIFIGADASGAGDSWRGQLGHVAIWDSALSDAAMHEISVMGHGIDLRNAGLEYGEQEALLHYWRLGDDSNGIGFDYGNASKLVDLDDASGGIDADDIVAEAPAVLQLADSR